MRIIGGKRLVSACLLAALGLAGCGMRGPETTGSIDTTARLSRDLTAEGQASAHPVDVYDAIARTLVYNRDLEAERMARRLTEAEAGLATVEMLPQVVASTQISARSNAAASASAPASDPTRSSGYSVSSERVSRSREMAFSWNLLDFGVAYFRARQAGHRSLIAAEQQRRTANALVEETRVVFWRAVALQQLDEGLRRMDGEMNRSIADADHLRAAGLTDPVEALSAERDLLAIRRELDQQRKLLVGADDQLRALMNYPATAPLVLTRSAEAPVPTTGRPSFAALADAVLANRPEIRQAILEQHITAEDARIALLELVPNLELVAGQSLESNPFLLHQGWLSLATRASWQLVKVAQYPARSEALASKAELDRIRTRALAAALVLQAQVSLSRFAQSRTEYATLERLSEVQRRLALQTEAARRVGRVGTRASTRERMNTLLAESRRDAARGEVQGAWANVLTSFGMDLADSGEIRGLAPETVAARLRQSEAQFFARVPEVARSSDRVAGLSEARR